MIGAGGINDEVFFPVISGGQKRQKERGMCVGVEQDMASNLEGAKCWIPFLFF